MGPRLSDVPPKGQRTDKVDGDERVHNPEVKGLKQVEHCDTTNRANSTTTSDGQNN